VIWLLAASLLWAFSFGLIKGELAGVDPVAVAAGRLLLAAMAFAPFALAGRCDRRTVLLAAALGVLQFGLMYVLYLASFRWLPAWLVAALTVFTPLYVVALASWGRGRPRARSLAAAALAVGGGALVTVRAAPGAEAWPGILLLQGSNLCFAAGQLGFARLRRRTAAGEAALLGWMYAGAAAATVLAVGVVAATGGRPGDGWEPRQLLVLLYLGLMPTAVGFYLWNKGAARTGAGLLGAANNLKVPLAVVLAWILFGETADYGRALAGLALVLGAIWLARTRGE
jgi:drug/metabolite transporter (DMT)-like permease